MKYKFTKNEVIKRVIVVELPDGTDYDTAAEMAYDGEFEEDFYYATPRQDELWYDTEAVDSNFREV